MFVIIAEEINMGKKEVVSAINVRAFPPHR
jgi:hypothetical protein